LLAGTAVAWLSFATSIASGTLFASEAGLRFDGYLLNPSAEALFLSFLLTVQLASIEGGAIVVSHQNLQRLNACGLLLLIVATFSRSSWIATVAALLVIGVLQFRQSKLSLALGIALLAMVVVPLTGALTPVAAQVSRGQAPTTLRSHPPQATPPPNLRSLLAALPSPSAPTSSEAAAPVAQPTPSAPVETVISRANALAAEQNGATDRLALDVFALQLWLHDLGSALTGIGLGVFFALTPFTAFGYPTVVHNTYLWLPVEMGLPGVAALIAFAYAAIWLLRACWRYHRGDFTTIAVGSFALFGTWGALNEGVDQRTLWLLFAVLSAVVAPVMLSPGDGRKVADPANRT
jgi:hypothetical protein